MAPDRQGGWRRTLLTVLATLAFLLFVATTVGIQGDSMEPSLHSGERVIVPRYETWLWRLGAATIHRGDIVFFPDPADPGRACPVLCNFVIKRVVALEGDEVMIRSGILSVNGVEQPEEYLGDAWRGSHSVPPLVVPEGMLYVLGDNRGPYGSRDSRGYGPVPAAGVEGRAGLVIWPLLRRGSDGHLALNVRPVQRPPTDQGALRQPASR